MSILFYLYIIPMVILWIGCIIAYKETTENPTVGGLSNCDARYGFILSFIPFMNVVGAILVVLALILNGLNLIWDKIKDIKI